MDLSKPITWAGIDLNSVTTAPTGQPVSGYKVQRITIDPPPLTQYIEKRALHDGLVASDVYLGGRNIKAIVTAYGTSAGDFWDKVQALHRVMSAPLRRFAAQDADQGRTEGFGFLEFYQPTASTGIGQWPTSAYPNGIPLAYNVRPLQMDYTLERAKDLVESDEGQSKSLELNWLALDGYRVHTTYQTAAVTVSGSSATLAYRGDFPAYPIITWSQTTDMGETMSIFFDGQDIFTGINVDGISASTNIFLDFNTRTFWDGDPLDEASSPRNEWFGSTFDFPQIDGTTVMRVTGMSNVIDNTVTIKVREAFA